MHSVDKSEFKLQSIDKQEFELQSADLSELLITYLKPKYVLDMDLNQDLSLI